MSILSMTQLSSLLESTPEQSNGLQNSALLLSGVSVDSRLVQPNHVFFALSGQKVDGHDFLKEAAARGAVAAVVKASYQGPDFGLSLFKMKDPLQGLQKAAKKKLAQSQARVIAVTGSVGKTTTKDFIATLLKQKYRVASSPGNHNSQIGLPLSIFNHFQGDEDFLVLEMGMTLPGQISSLIEIAPPEIALVTTVALMHAANFSSLTEIAQAKGEIFLHPATKIGFLPRELENYAKIVTMGTCQKRSFSQLLANGDYFLQEEKNGKLKVSCSEGHFWLPQLTLPGTHNNHNFLAAAVVVRHLQMSWEEIKMTIPTLKLPESRLQTVRKEGVLFINDSYNACAVSIKAALQSLPQPAPQRKVIAVLGEMLELGRFSEQCHKEVGEAALEVVDHMFCLGKGCYPIWECWKKAGRPVALFEEFSDLLSALRQQLQPGDVVLIKGARKHELERVLKEYP